MLPIFNTVALIGFVDTLVGCLNLSCCRFIKNFWFYWSYVVAASGGFGILAVTAGDSFLSYLVAGSGFKLSVVGWVGGLAEPALFLAVFGGETLLYLVDG